MLPRAEISIKYKSMEVKLEINLHNAHQSVFQQDRSRGNNEKTISFYIKRPYRTWYFYTFSLHKQKLRDFWGHEKIDSQQR